MELQKITSIPIGTALVERPILNALSRLWEGPVGPEDLDSIELGLRAFFTSKRLLASQVQDVWTSVSEGILGRDYEYEPPFRDGLLDYEFLWPDHLPVEKSVLQSLPEEETSFLSLEVRSILDREIRDVLSRRTFNNAQSALSFLDSWYSNLPQIIYEDRYEDYINENFNLDKFFSGEYVHPLNHLYPINHAEYYIKCHRSGLIIFSDSVIGRICEKHVFSEWPMKIFEKLDQDYKETMRSLRAPGITVELPPLMSIVLSIAESRNDIPTTIRDLRDEYMQARNNLWSIIELAWSAPNLNEQYKYLTTLKEASISIFPAAFPERYNILSIGLDFAQLNPSGLASGFQKILGQDYHNSKVTAVGFAKKLSTQLRSSIINIRTILNRHFENSELKSFGLI